MVSAVKDSFVTRLPMFAEIDITESRETKKCKIKNRTVNLKFT